jgi:hypothetical protein
MYLTVYAVQGRQFLQFVATEDKIQVNHATPETKTKKSMTWRHPFAQQSS